MIELIKKVPEFKPEIGDLPFNNKSLIEDYLLPKKESYSDLFDSGFRMLPVSFFGSYDPFVTLILMEVNLKGIVDNKYKCPFILGNEYYGIVPIGINTTSLDQYRNIRFKDKFYDFVFDLDFQKDYMISILEETGDIIRSFLGHGYDSYRLPSDGSIRTIVIKIKMKNEDYLVAKTFEWYNK